MDAAEDWKKDKFQVRSMQAPSATMDPTALTELWKSAPKGSDVQQKIICTHAAGGSPDPLPAEPAVVATAVTEPAPAPEPTPTAAESRTR